MKKKLASLFLVFALISALVVGCGGKDDGSQSSSNKGDEKDITLTWAVFETDNYTADVWQEIIDTYEADNPGVKIEKVLFTGDSRPQFLKTMLAAGNMPDINIDPIDLASTQGVYAEVPAELMDKFEEGALVTYDGKYNLVPSLKQLRSQCYYHKDQFKEAGIDKEPETWDEFIDVCEKLKAADKVPLMGVGASDLWATSFGYFSGVINSDIMNAYPEFNKDLADGKVSWTDPVVEESVSHWKELIDAGYYHKGSMSFSYIQATEEFANGEAAMMLDGSWQARTFDKKGVSIDEIGVFPVPAPSGAKNYCTMSQYWGVSESCKNKEEAFKFCEYVLGGNPDIYKLYLECDGMYSVTKTPVEYEAGAIQQKFSDNYEGYELVDEITKLAGDYALPTGFEDYTQKSLQNVFTGADVKPELEKWDAEMKKLQAN